MNGVLEGWNIGVAPCEVCLQDIYFICPVQPADHHRHLRRAGINTLVAETVLVEDVDTSLSSGAGARGVEGCVLGRSEVVAREVTEGRLHIGLVEAQWVEALVYIGTTRDCGRDGHPSGEDLQYFAWISLEAVLAGADPAAVRIGAVGVDTTVVPAFGTLVLVPTA